MKKMIVIIGVLAMILLLAGCVQKQEGKPTTTAGETINTSDVESGLTELDSLITESDAGIEDLNIDSTTFQ